MAERRIAWACSHKCGRNVITSKGRMADHEKTCWCNPDVRGCKTCLHDKKEMDDNGCEGAWLETWLIRYCDIDKLPEDKNATRNCLYWKAHPIQER